MMRVRSGRSSSQLFNASIVAQPVLFFSCYVSHLDTRLGVKVVLVLVVMAELGVLEVRLAVRRRCARMPCYMM